MNKIRLLLFVLIFCCLNSCSNDKVMQTVTEDKKLYDSLEKKHLIDSNITYLPVGNYGAPIQSYLLTVKHSDGCLYVLWLNGKASEMMHSPVCKNQKHRK